MIVYTCGTFDMFHIGHLNLLRAAKELGGTLVVGVSTDEVVESYKPGVLVVPFDQRLQIVTSICYVDIAIAQHDRDKFEAWRRIRYDVLAVGDDWKGTPEFERHERMLGDVGARVAYLPYTRSVSSTYIRATLEQRGTTNEPS